MWSPVVQRGRSRSGSLDGCSAAGRCPHLYACQGTPPCIQRALNQARANRAVAQCNKLQVKFWTVSEEQQVRGSYQRGVMHAYMLFFLCLQVQVLPLL